MLNCEVKVNIVWAETWAVQLWATLHLLSVWWTNKSGWVGPRFTLSLWLAFRHNLCEYLAGLCLVWWHFTLCCSVVKSSTYYLVAGFTCCSVWQNNSAMALLQALASLVNKRLSAAAQEIFGSVGQMITEYEDEAFSLKKDIERQSRLLDMVLKSYIREPGWYHFMNSS